MAEPLKTTYSYCRSRHSEVFRKNVFLKISQNTQEDTRKIDLKLNLKMNLKIDSNKLVFFCRSCKIFNNVYFVEHLRTAAASINTDAKYSLPGQ